MAAEPQGQVFGIFKMLYIDARTGALNLYELPVKSSLIGPNRAVGYVHAAFPSYNWKEKDKGNITTLEPRPLIKNGVLYWMITVTTDTYAGVSQTVLVDSRSGDVRSFKSLSGIQDFIAGKSEGEAVGQQNQTQTGVSETPTDIGKLTDAQLYQLLRQIADELNRRHQ